MPANTTKIGAKMEPDEGRWSGYSQAFYMYGQEVLHEVAPQRVTRVHHT